MSTKYAGMVAVPAEQAPFGVPAGSIVKVRPLNGGTQVKVEFGNGRGASVVQHDHSYGGTSGYWELAVLDGSGDIDYSTPLTGDVIGWLDTQQVEEHLATIAGYPHLSGVKYGTCAACGRVCATLDGDRCIWGCPAKNVVGIEIGGTWQQVTFRTQAEAEDFHLLLSDQGYTVRLEQGE